jgi:HAD superfamily hydrolase (TIGR01509 family)
MQALIFDVDGTLADTEAVHLGAFNAAFAEVGLDWYWDTDLYARLLSVAGGKERILHYWRIVDPEEASGCRISEVIDAVHAIKTRHYAAQVRSGDVPLRPGIRRLIEEANLIGMPLAIATTTTPQNVDALLAAAFGPDWRRRFAVVCDAGSVTVKKPAPDVYQAVLKQLGVSAAACIALEDSANGLRAARAASIQTVVTPTAFTAHDDFSGALWVLPHLGDPEAPMPTPIPGAGHAWVDLSVLRHWHRDSLLLEA